MKLFTLITLAFIMIGCDDIELQENNNKIETITPVDVSATIETDYTKIKLEK